MSKVWNLAGAALLAWLAAGCETGYQRPSPAPAAPLAATRVPAEPAIVVPAAPIVPTPAPPPAVTAPPAPARPAWPSNWVDAWIPLESWGLFNGLEKPRQLNGGVEAAYLLPTTGGAMTLRLGSHTLRFCGMDFRLGFAPRAIKGLPYIHSVDARKTLQPLLAPAWPPPQINRTIVLDPGHGGKDSGTRSSINGENEKLYALDWARRLERLLVNQGWKVVLTRTNDTYLSLPERVAVADATKADLFLSLHFNAAEDNGVRAGVETYCLAPTGMPSSLDRGFGDDTREWHPNNAFDDQNFQLAAALHRAVLGATGAADRGVCRARFLGVLRGQTRPAVLIEGGYLSNPAEARKIATSAYRQSLAEGVAKVLE